MTKRLLVTALLTLMSVLFVVLLLHDSDAMAQTVLPVPTKVRKTSTPTRTAGKTLAPTRTLTSTPAPFATPTAITGEIPLCAQHDPTKWHPLYDESHGCHYDHTHNDNPNSPQAVAIFGYAGERWGRQEMSYPWATSAMENTMKHGGLKYVVRLGIPCNASTQFNGFTPVSCITDARIEYHTVGGIIDANARYHSFYLEYRVCAYPAYSVCGIMRYGGWMDMGTLINPYPGNRQVRAGGMIDFGKGSQYGGNNEELMMTYAADPAEMNAFHVPNDPYVAVTPYDIITWQSVLAGNASARDVWSMGQFGFDQRNDNVATNNPYARFLVRVRDSWNLVPTADNLTAKWICSRDANFTPVEGAKIPNNCPYNNSIHSLNELTVRLVDMNSGDILPEFANFVSKIGDVDVITYHGYTNRYGQLTNGCAQPALDCVPFDLEGVPIDIAAYSDPGDGNNADKEYDTSPAGKFWIEYPN